MTNNCQGGDHSKESNFSSCSYKMNPCGAVVPSLYLRCTFGQPKFVRSQTSSWKSGRIKSPGSREPKWLAASIGFEHKSAAGCSFWQNMLLPQRGGAWHVWFLESDLFEVCFLWKASSGEWSLCPNQSAPDFGRCLAYMTVMCGRIQRIYFLLSNQTVRAAKWTINIDWYFWPRFCSLLRHQRLWFGVWLPVLSTVGYYRQLFPFSAGISLGVTFSVERQWMVKSQKGPWQNQVDRQYLYLEQISKWLSKLTNCKLIKCIWDHFGIAKTQNWHEMMQATIQAVWGQHLYSD